VECQIRETQDGLIDLIVIVVHAASPGFVPNAIGHAYSRTRRVANKRCQRRNQA